MVIVKWFGDFKKIIVYFFLLALSLYFLSSSPNSPWGYGYSSIDSSVFRYFGWRMSFGEIPYKDMFDHKGPLLYLINLLGVSIDYNFGIWIVEFVCLFVCFVFSYRTFKLLGCSDGYSVLGIVTVYTLIFRYLEKGNLTEEYAMLFISISQYLFVKFILNIQYSYINSLVIGICLGAVLFIRPNMIAVWIGYGITVLLYSIWQKKLDIFFSHIVVFIAGIAVVGIPIIGWMFSVDCLKDCFDYYIKFNILYLMERVQNPEYFEIFRFFFTKYDNYIFFIIGFCAILMAYKLLIDKKDICKNEIMVFIGSYISIFLSIWIICSPGNKYGHYGLIILPLLIVPVGILMTEKDYFFQSKDTKNLLKCVFFSILLLIVVPYNFNIIDKNFNSYLNPKKNIALETVSDFIKKNTTKDEEILVLGNENVIYLKSLRRASTKFSYQSPPLFLSKELKESFMKEIKVNKPKLLVYRKKSNVNRINVFNKNISSLLKYKKVYENSLYVVYSRS